MKSILIYGKHSVLAAMFNSRRHVDEIFITKKCYEELEDQILKSDRKSLIKIVDNSYIKRIAGEENASQGILLKARTIEQPTFDQAVRKFKEGNILIIDGIEDPRNLGSIIRSAAAFGIKFIVLPKHNTPEESSYMLKSAAGYFEKIPLVYVSNIYRSMELLKKEGYWIIGLDAGSEKNLTDVQNFEKTALLIGAEGKGIRHGTLKGCDIVAKIFMESNVESLNVSNAAAIAMYELYKLKQ
ncbi:SpoU family RNA methyltransferase [Candidatus Cyrtobacter comes]|uniref:SpoU family RNA methyltransferase n=1 Tax=Candidatus Cyrtobacter comes TaxID=675776 RepID=A0ABU5L832_9RICK|nr:23S rRNA (guanosine(2251)-2'-O)-methyltransferase RlmB [Candidatus Cyrtobacter comes]MDZ5762282.1 SpoU family RNA methyltransferase [Candidatus Cyrtobacter comes]